MTQGKPGIEPELPKLDFTTFILSLRASASVHLGDEPGPDGKLERDLELAQDDIAILSLLHEKTKGNLTGEEERLLDEVLDEARERYEEIAKG